jgi:hypothetical protein
MFADHEKRGAEDGGIAALRDTIRRAFPTVTYTGKITRHDGVWLPELTEENAIHDDDKFVYEALQGRKWTDVPKSFLHEQPDGFVLLTEEALVAFVAAWLMCSLDDIDGENNVREFLVYSFSPSPNFLGGNTDFKVSRLRALSPEQRFVVRALLAEFAECEVDSSIRADAAKGVALIDSLPFIGPSTGGGT